MRKSYESSRFNDQTAQAIKKIYITDFSCTQGRMCVYGHNSPAFLWNKVNVPPVLQNTKYYAEIDAPTYISGREILFFWSTCKEDT